MNKNNMLYGAFVGDAMALAVHWMYNTEEIETRYKNRNEIGYPLVDKYHSNKNAGDFTHYGDQSLWLLEYLKENEDFNIDSYREFWIEKMKNYTGYVDSSMRNSLEAFQKGEKHGSNSLDLGGVSQIAPLIWKYDEEKALENSLEFVKLTHNNPKLDVVVKFIVKSVFKILNGEEIEKALHDASNELGDIWLESKLEKAKDFIGVSVFSTVKTVNILGQSCGVEGALSSALYLVLKYKDNLEEALVNNNLAGGETASRAMIIGMILGAGNREIPSSWTEIVNSKNTIEL